jgi:tryptophanyl-tRNA synthetase
VSHIELTREIARRFNHLFGREKGFEEKAIAAIKKLGSKKAKLYNDLRTSYQQDGDDKALDAARELISDVQNLSMGDRERLFGYLEGGGKVILPEPQALLTPTAKLIGLDGQKMSKSYNNTIDLRDTPDEISAKVRKMPTDPARIRRTDKGDPERCPVWTLHQVYSEQSTRDWVVEGCRSAGIGCLECKQPVIDGIVKELKPMRERAAPFEEDPTLVKNIIADGCEKARDTAEETMRDVRDAMGLNYR